MKSNWMLSAAIAVMAVAAAGAQSMKDMSKPAKHDTMKTTYTGCVETANHEGTFLLTKVTHGDMAMKHDDMAMKADADGKMDAMPQKPFVLAGSTDLKTHVGQKVSITGTLSTNSMGPMPDHSTLTIRTLKVVAKSCS